MECKELRHTREVCSWMTIVWWRITSSGALPLSTWITSRTKRPNLIILPRRICYSKPAFCNPLLQVMQYLTGVSIYLQLGILIFQSCNQRIKFAPKTAIPGPCCNWKWHQSFGQMVEYLTPTALQTWQFNTKLKSLEHNIYSLAARVITCVRELSLSQSKIHQALQKKKTNKKENHIEKGENKFLIVYTDLVLTCSDKTPVQKPYSVWIISNVTYKIPRLHCNNLNTYKRISYPKTWSCRLQACIQWNKILEEKEVRKPDLPNLFSKVTFQSLEYIQENILQNPKTRSWLHSAEQSSSRIRGKKARPHKAFFQGYISIIQIHKTGYLTNLEP